MERKLIELNNYYIKSQEALEFTKVIHHVSEYAVSDDAKTKIVNLLNEELLSNPEDTLELVSQIKDFLQFHPIPLSFFSPIETELSYLKIDNYYYTPESFKKFYQLCLNSATIVALKKRVHNAGFTQFCHLIDMVPDLDDPLCQLKKVFDENFEVKDAASKELEKLRKSITILKNSIHQLFKKEVEFNRTSIRNGRYVLRVLAEHKRKIPGLIVDESDSGKTIFIEPQRCLEQNNELIQLHMEEKRLIIKILILLTDKIKYYSNDFKLAYDILVKLDVHMAKANFAMKINARKPTISKNNTIKLINAYHPLLLLKFFEKQKLPAPLNIKLDRENFIILISGPNAGGKTIVLKTIGLLQLMVQKGMLVPVDKGSSFSLFKNIWVDIGDRQSIDEGLSTYSARLSYMKELLENVDKNSLVLLDELGSGTEPIIGGAIAESILSELVKRNVFGVITTHYTNLKSFAHKTKGIVNGAMSYDEKRMEPKYLLQIGKPGSSYALDIANKLKFPKHLINYAKNKSGKNIVELEDLISKLEKEKSTLEKTNNEFKSRIQSLNKLIKAYEDIQKQFEIKRLKLKLETKELEYQKSNTKREVSKKLIEEIRANLDLNKANNLHSENIKNIELISKELNEISQSYNELMYNTKVAKPIHKGDKVYLIRHNMTGTVSEIKGDNLKVITEFVTFNVKNTEISILEEDLIKSKKKSVLFDLKESAIEFVSSLDIRGQSAQTAIKLLDDYLDKAILANAKEVRIIHGKGTGVLREKIHNTLRGYKFIDKFMHPDGEQGGLGITVIVFK
jgi:DNA mismatch repair protein MutS2